MRSFYGAVTETNDLGVVAEDCPHCDSLKRCLLRKVSRSNYFCFVKLGERARENSCMCTECLKTFSGKPQWSYAQVVPIRDAREMELNELLAKTNPILADRIQFKEQIRELGGDERFATACERVEGLQPGRRRSDLLKKLLNWSRLSDKERDELEEYIGSLSRAWQFARQMAVGFPTSSGALIYFMSVPVLGGILIWMCATGHWLWGGLALAGGVAAATFLEVLFKRMVSRWSVNVLIPDAQEANVSLEHFVTVIDDIPATNPGLTEELWPMKHQLQNIREKLIAEGKLPQTPTQAKR